MKVRQAILNAADHIEAKPELYNYMTVDVPAHRYCGSPGCALGWIGFFGGIKMSRYGFRAMAPDVAEDFLGLDESQFYNRLSEFNTEWTDQPEQCADALRRYADKYHPAAVEV